MALGVVRRGPSLYEALVGAGSRDRIRAHFGNQVADFVESLTEAKPASPTFREAMATDLVTDAVLRSAKSGRWEEVKSY